MVKALPNGPRYFPEDQITDQPVRFMAAELIREHVLMQTHEEVPHAVWVLIEQFEESPRLVRIAAVIYCERDGQKAILLGKGGQMLKKIGTAARLDIEKMVGTKVFSSFSSSSGRLARLGSSSKNSIGGVNYSRSEAPLTRSREPGSLAFRSPGGHG